jgi:hypothetical protein
MSRNGRGHQVNGWLCDAMIARRIASPDRAGAMAEFSHTRRPPHGRALVMHVLTATARGGVCLISCDAARPTRRDQSSSRQPT